MKNYNHEELNIRLDRLTLVPWFIASALFGALVMFLVMSF